MLPDYVLSTTPSFSPIVGARSYAGSLIVDYEDGGVDIQDTSEGLLYQTWKAAITEDKTTILLSADNKAEYTFITGTEITEVSLTFDQNMNPCVAYVEDGISKFYWYDTSIPSYDTLIINGSTPKVFLDDKRNSQTGNSDILLFYLRDDNLYHGVQRDRFLTEYLLASDVSSDLISVVGMGKDWRVQIHLFIC